MVKGIYALGDGPYNVIYGEAERHDIDQLVDIYAAQQTRESVQQDPSVMHDTEVMLSGWGAPKMDAAFLESAPNLKAVFYGAGSIKSIVSEEFWQRGILITSAYAANAVPVAEYALSQILFCLKSGYRHADSLKREKASKRFPVAGGYGSTVGIVSLGMIGTNMCELLRHFDLKVIAYDPYVDPERGRQLGAEMWSLEELFERADVVSLHTPWLKETEGMIKGSHFESMKPNAAFINTSRGAVVSENEMIEVLKKRPDLQAVLDVTHPEPPEPDSPLYILPNVVLTPHIAGSMERECNRMGRYMVDELKRYLNGEPLVYGIDKEKAARLA